MSFNFGTANENQIKAITATEGPLLIIAGPGTGKTFTLIKRAMYLIETKSIKPELLVNIGEPSLSRFRDKSFHVDNHCFDSKPELELFYQYIKSSKIKEVYFTGMFTGKGNGLSIQYIDPESKIVRNYYPDFIALHDDGHYEIIEVKGDNMIDDKIVEAKYYAALELAEDSKMEYSMYTGSKIMKKGIL